MLDEAPREDTVPGKPGLDRLRHVIRAISLQNFDSKITRAQTGSDRDDELEITRPHTCSVSSPSSLCAPWRGEIEKALEKGLSIQRIYQDLVGGHGFTGGCHSARRFVLRLGPAVGLPFRRLECPPGQEVRVDFGQGAWVAENGKRRRTHLFRCVLSFSRKGHSEVVWRQTAESFLRALENAFGHCGGVLQMVVIDILATVSRSGIAGKLGR